jgi:hypothetical protein
LIDSGTVWLSSSQLTKLERWQNTKRFRLYPG